MIALRFLIHLIHLLVISNETLENTRVRPALDWFLFKVKGIGGEVRWANGVKKVAGHNIGLAATIFIILKFLLELAGIIPLKKYCYTIYYVCYKPCIDFRILQIIALFHKFNIVHEL